MSRTARRKAMAFHAHKVRISRLFAALLANEYITKANGFPYHARRSCAISRRQRRPYHSTTGGPKGVFMAKTSHELAIEFAVEITELCSKIKGRPEYTKQLIRSASSISANIAEAKYAESNADFVHKLEIAQKEANETENWLSVLFKSGIIDELTFKSLRNKCGKIRRMLIASITTVKAKINGQK